MTDKFTLILQELQRQELIIEMVALYASLMIVCMIGFSQWNEKQFPRFLALILVVFIIVFLAIAFAFGWKV